jgi:uncharacterized membrane protein YhaH (DUF805 family)
MEWGSWVLFSFQGRINRLVWLGFFACLALTEAAMGTLLHTMEGSAAPVGSAPLEEFFGDRAALVAQAIFLWPSLATDVKRWHDLGKSGWLTVIAYGPLSALYLAVGLKNWGVLPVLPLPGVLGTGLGMIFLVYLVLLGAGRSAPGTNRFGEAAS